MDDYLTRVLLIILTIVMIVIIGAFIYLNFVQIPREDAYCARLNAERLSIYMGETYCRTKDGKLLDIK